MTVPALTIPALAVACTTLLVLVAFLATRPKQKKSTIRLAPEQRAAIQDHFNQGPTLAGSYGWSRRQYAPMHIHSKAFSSLREQIAAQLPDHAVAFDVVFESAGKRVDWHGASASAKFISSETSTPSMRRLLDPAREAVIRTGLRVARPLRLRRRAVHPEPRLRLGPFQPHSRRRQLINARLAPRVDNTSLRHRQVGHLLAAAQAPEFPVAAALLALRDDAAEHCRGRQLLR